MNKTIKNTNYTKSKSTTRLKRYLLFLLAFLPAIAILSLLFFSNLNNERILLKQARTLLENSTAESLRHTTEFLHNAEKQAHLTVSLIQGQVIRGKDYKSQEKFLTSILDLNSEIAGLYVADHFGNFFYTSRSLEHADAIYKTKQLNVTESGKISNIWWHGKT